MQKTLTTQFEKFSARATKVTGKPIAFILAFLIIISWVITGPIFHYSDTWQLVINTGHYHHYLPDGIPDTAIAKQGYPCPAAKAK